VCPVAPLVSSCSDGVSDGVSEDDDDDDGFSITRLSLDYYLKVSFVGLLNHCVSHHTSKQKTYRSCRSEVKTSFTKIKIYA
jgi:hypothetical protein